MVRRHEIQVLRRAGHALDEIAQLVGVSQSSVQRVEAEPPVANAAPTAPSPSAPVEASPAFEASFVSSSEASLDPEAAICIWYRCSSTEDEYPTQWAWRLECNTGLCRGVNRCP